MFRLPHFTLYDKSRVENRRPFLSYQPLVGAVVSLDKSLKKNARGCHIGTHRFMLTFYKHIVDLYLTDSWFDNGISRACATFVRSPFASHFALTFQQHLTEDSIPQNINSWGCPKPQIYGKVSVQKRMYKTSVDPGGSQAYSEERHGRRAYL